MTDRPGPDRGRLHQDATGASPEGAPGAEGDGGTDTARADDALDRDLARRHAEIAALTAAIVRKEEEIERLRRDSRGEADRLRAELARAEETILYTAGVYANSTSWRITAPMRRAGQGLSRLLRRS